MKRRIFYHSLLVFTSVIVFLIILEGGCRLIMSRPPPSMEIENLEKSLSGRADVPREIEERPTDVLYVKTFSGVRMKPSMRVLVKNHTVSGRDIELTTNELGYRGPNLGEKQKNDFRILVLGDSITLGDYVEYEETYPYKIEEFLQKESQGEINIQVINAGVGSIGLENELAILKESGLFLKPDIVLVGLFLNDAFETAVFWPNSVKLPQFLRRSYLFHGFFKVINLVRFTRGYLKFSQAQMYREKEKFVEQNQVADQDWRESEDGINYLIAQSFLDWGFAFSPLYWQKIEPLLGEMKKLAQENHFHLAVVFLPVKYQVESVVVKNEPQNKFNEILTKMEIDYFDPLPSLRKKYQEDQASLYYDHCHYTPGGNGFLGEVIGQLLLGLIEKR